jgi:hypothetical protein
MSGQAAGQAELDREYEIPGELDSTRFTEQPSAHALQVIVNGLNSELARVGGQNNVAAQERRRRQALLKEERKDILAMLQIALAQDSKDDLYTLGQKIDDLGKRKATTKPSRGASTLICS